MACLEAETNNMQLLLATENQGKKRELVSLLANQGIECLLPSEVLDSPITFPEENGEIFAENAFIKANFLYKKTLLPTLADDSGISVVSLNNFPGIKSARWVTGDETSRYKGLLEKMKNETQREAFFTCVLCLITPSSPEPHYFEGILKGILALEQKGSEGFGYDPIFVPEGETKTLAELGLEYKNTYSHRAVALQKLVQFLKENMLN